MPDTDSARGRTFDENIDALFDELVLAERWQRPSLLLAVHKSKIGQEKAEKALEGRLEAAGFGVVSIAVNDKRSDITRLMRDEKPPPKSVYFISNIDWGGGEDGREAYRGLNLHRELFVDEGIKAVFWLTVNEAANLPRFAPDFWAFRHRVVEFVSQRAAGKVQLPAGILAWDAPMSQPDPFDSARTAIEAREELLRRLPDSMEALSARVELHAGLAQLQWRMGELERSETELRAGLRLATDLSLADLRAGLLNGLGIVAYERGQHAAALERFADGLRYRSSSRVLLINTSATNCMLGRVEEALTLGKRALRANVMEADTWRRLGYIQNAVGRMDEGIASLAKAAELAPRAPENHVGLAVLYSLIDRSEDARNQITRAAELGGRESVTLFEVVREAVIGHADKAVALLAEAVSSGRVSRHGVSRDVDLGLLFEPGQLEQVLG